MILITGGTGYIGKNIALHLLLKGEKVFLIDNFSNSSPSAYHTLKDIMKEKNIPEKNLHIFILDISCAKDINIWLNNNYAFVTKTYNLPPITAVIHCAGHKSVPDSIHNPLEYYKNNIMSTINIIELTKQLNKENTNLNLPPIPIIFSSSITVYGNVSSIHEHVNCNIQSITSPYGKTKLINEEILKDSSKDVKSVCLRYFNPIGCYSKLGEEITEKTTNIVPSLIKSIRNNTFFNVYGGDYATRDGSCIRDYIDVRDLAEAHYLAIKFANTMNTNFDIFNLGTKNGTSVKELLDAFEKVKGIKIKYEVVERRDGDSACSTCSSDKAYRILNWTPSYKLEESIKNIQL